jgi:localization factor PodJL
MNRIASSHFDSFDPEVIEAARDVANRAGVPLEAWIASVMPQTNAPMTSRSHRSDDTVHQAAGDSAPSAAPRPAGTSAGTAPTVGETGTDGVQPVPVTALISRLDGIDRSMEAERRAEQRRLEQIEARIDLALKSGPVQQVTERLGDIERRVAQLGDQVAHTKPLGKRGKVAAEEMREAVLEIRQRQRELAENGQPEGVVASLHRDISRRLGGEASSVRRPIGLPAYVAEELEREAVRLRGVLTQFPASADIIALDAAVVALADAIERAHAGIDLATIALPIALVRARIEQLSSEASAALHNEAAADIQHFSSRLDVAAAFDDAKAAGTPLHSLFGELEQIRQAVSALAEPARVDELVKRIQILSAKVTQSLPPHEAELRPILEEIRSEEKTSDIVALAAEIHALVAKVEELHAAAQADAAARIAVEAEAAVALEAEEEAAAQAEAAASTSSDVASLHAMLQSLAEKVDRVNERAGPDGLDALERHVLTLVDKIESPHVLDPALSGLGRTMSDLMGQVEALRAASPNEEQIERATRTAVSETLQAANLTAGNGELGLLRASLADMQARQIASDERLSSTLESVQTALDRLVTRLGSAEQASSPRPPSLDERLLTSTSPEASRGARRAPALDASDVTVADLLAEVLLEPGAPRPPRGPAPASEPALPKAHDLKAHDLKAPEPKTLELKAPEPKKTEPKKPEPKKAEIKVSEAVRPETQPGAADGDIKTSFIAAARRAAQAAQAELAAEAPLERHTRTRPAAAVAPVASRVSRLRAGVDQHRRPVLLGLAAIVLTLGAFGLRYGDDGAQVQQLAQAPEVAPQQPAEAEKLAEATKSPEAPQAAGVAAPEAGAPAQPVAKAPEAAPATAKPAIPQVVGMAGLAGDLATVPPVMDRLKQAALSGDGRAVWELAMRESEGRGMPRDLTVATKLFERLATAGYAPAQYKVGAHYEKGTGVARDLAQAKLWYGRAAEQGHARAMHNLGVIFAENPGPGGKPDFASAATWFRQGAEHGVRDSQYNIAVLYARGLGLSQDLVQSFAWFSAAAAQGDEDAGKKRDDVATKLNAPDLARAKSLAASFKPRRLDPSVNEPPVIQDVSQGPMSLLGAPVPAATAYSPPPRKAI